MTTGERILNALTIVGYVFVGLFVFVAIYLGIAYAAGYFNPQREPVVGLQFTNSDEVIISENGGTATLQIVSSSATIETDENGEQIITDPATPTEVRLTVRDPYGSTNNSIISVPSTVMTGETFTITANTYDLDGEDWNVGGDCYIFAETADRTYRALPIHVFVDIPVKEIIISATNPTTGEAINLDVADFIKDDEVNLTASVYPANALNPHYNGEAGEPKVIEFLSSDTLRAMIRDRYSGLVSIVTPDVNTSDEAVTEPTLVTITARMPSTYATDGFDITATCDLRIFPLQLDEIQIQNGDYDDAADMIEFDLDLDPDAEPLRFSASATGNSDIINLDIFLRPEKYNSASSTDPLSNLMQQLQMTYVSSIEGFTPALTITQVLENGVVVWTVRANRTIEPNEQVSLVIGLTGRPAKNIERLVQINYTTPEELIFVDESGVETNQITLQIVKDGDERQPTQETELGLVTNYQLAPTYTNSSTPTFTKIVYFIQNEDAYKYNETGSYIIEVNEYGQVLETGGLDYIVAAGAGTIQVTPYVVRTNSAGEPVDCNYRVITEGTALGVRTINRNSSEPVTEAGYYIAYNDYTYDPITINVEEILTNFSIYTDPEFRNVLDTTNNNSDSPLRIGTSAINSKTLYAKPNSPLALPLNRAEYLEWRHEFGNIHFTSRQSEGSLQIPNEDLSNVDFRESVTEEGYQRYIEFSVSTQAATETRSMLTIFLTDENGANIRSLTTQIYINAYNIHVEEQNIVTEGTQISDSVSQQFSNIKNWQLFLNISETQQTYNNRNYTWLYWRQADGSIPTMPDIEYVASDEWTSAGFRPSVGIDNPIIRFYAFDYTSETYDLSDTDPLYQNLDIRQVINLEFDLTDPTQASMNTLKWEIINSLLNSTTVDEYATIETIDYDNDASTASTQTIQIKKELPSNYWLFMVFMVDDPESTAEPEFIRIDYNFPEVHFFDYTALLQAGGSYDIETENYIITEDSNTLYFQQSNFLGGLVYNPLTDSITEINDVYDPYTDSVLLDGFTKIITDAQNTYSANYANMFTGSSRLYFNFEMVNSITDIGTDEEITGYFLSIGLNTNSYRIRESDVDSVYTMSMTRSTNFVLYAGFTEEIWADPENALGQFETLDQYFQYLVPVSSTIDINIMIQGGEIVTITQS